MTVFAFHAECIVTEHPDGECHLVGFADKKHDTELYLMLQRSFEDDEQDIKLGMNTFHVEWCGQEGSGHGGITRFTLKPAAAEVSFETRMAEALGGMTSIISFQLPVAELQALKEALSRVFSGSNCFAIADA